MEVDATQLSQLVEAMKVEMAHLFEQVEITRARKAQLQTEEYNLLSQANVMAGGIQVVEQILEKFGTRPTRQPAPMPVVNYRNDFDPVPLDNRHYDQFNARAAAQASVMDAANRQQRINFSESGQQQLAEALRNLSFGQRS